MPTKTPVRFLSSLLPLASYLLPLAFCLSLACPRPLPPPVQKVIDCSGPAIRDRGLPLIPKVNACLLDPTFMSCLIALITPVAGITEDIVACVVRSSGSSFAANAQVNPSDAVSKQNAERARAFLVERGYQFVGQ